MPIVLNPDQQAALQAVIDAAKALDAAKEAGVRAADAATKILTRGSYSFNGHMIRLLGYGCFTVERLENVPGEVPHEPLAERVSWEGVEKVEQVRSSLEATLPPGNTVKALPVDADAAAEDYYVENVEP